VHLADRLGFLDGLLAPDAGHDVVGDASGRQQVVRHHRELERGAALEEEHLVVGRNAGQLARVGLGLRVHGFVDLAAVAVLGDADAAALDAPEIFLRLAQDRFRKRRGTGAEVPDPARRGLSRWGGLRR
jgi:hypothetical protein